MGLLFSFIKALPIVSYFYLSFIQHILTLDYYFLLMCILFSFIILLSSLFYLIHLSAKPSKQHWLGYRFDPKVVTAHMKGRTMKVDSWNGGTVVIKKLTDNR